MYTINVRIPQGFVNVSGNIKFDIRYRENIDNFYRELNFASHKSIRITYQNYCKNFTVVINKKQSVFRVIVLYIIFFIFLYLPISFGFLRKKTTGTKFASRLFE